MGGFVYWWQHLPAHMDPEIFRLGSLRVQWYGLMYIVAFAVTYFVTLRRIRTEERYSMYDREFLKNILTWGFIGVLAGGRLGYVLFYNLPHYLDRPWEIVFPFSFQNGCRFTGISGMSYHGGILGCFAACALFCRKYKADFLKLADLFFPGAALGYTFGRLGNFINGELYGRHTDAAIGMYFPDDPDRLRHPSQLYEALFEGIFLFAVLWALRKLPLPKGALIPVYLFGYGFVRFCIEYFRQPDSHLGLIGFGVFTMGQMLCMGMMAAGLILFFFLRRRDKQAVQPT